MMDNSFCLINNDNLTHLKQIPDNFFHSIVTDPPYGIRFMGKRWDYMVPSVELWEECLRVIKPGGYLLSFGGTKTYHRLVVNAEDAGFNVRDMLVWVYGQGIPKGLNISKSLEKKYNKILTNVLNNTELSKADSELLKAAEKWSGWNTTLKPAFEPILMAQKPVATSTIVDNVLLHGVGGINIDACRVPLVTGDPVNDRTFNSSFSNTTSGIYGASNLPAPNKTKIPMEGRYPANLLHDGSDEVINQFPIYENVRTNNSRFFYCTKATNSDRNSGLDNVDIINNHLTVKPFELMSYLVRLVTPEDGIVFDPFMGSGSTGKACAYEKFRFYGIDDSFNSYKIATYRIKHAYDLNKLPTET